MSGVYDFVPKPLGFKQKVSAIWSILRNERTLGRGGGWTVLYTLKPYVIQAVFKDGTVVYVQNSMPPESVAEPGQTYLRAVLRILRREEPWAVVESCVWLRVVRRRDASVVFEAGHPAVSA